MDALQDSLPRGGGLPTRLVPKVEFDTNGSLTVGRESKPDFGLLAATTLIDFVNDKVNEALIIDLLRHEGIVNLLKDKGVSIIPMAFAYNILQPMITRQLVMQNGIQFNEGEFASNYRAFEEYMNSEEDRYILSAPLSNFTMESDIERIGPFTIRKLNADEFAAYNGITADPDSLARSISLPHLEFVLEMPTTVKRGSPALTQTNQECFWWLVAIMKLTKAGSVGYTTIWGQPLSWSGMSFGVGNAYPRYTVVGRPYILQNQDLPGLRAHWEIVETFSVGRLHSGQQLFSDSAMRSIGFELMRP